MTPFEFNAPELNGKAEAACRGTYLIERISGKLLVPLYFLPRRDGDVYDQAANQITGFEAFTTACKTGTIYAR